MNAAPHHGKRRLDSRRCANDAEELRSVQREYAADIGDKPLCHSRFGPLCVVMVVKYAAIRQLPARENFAQFLG
jgi:hypothetical protein